MFYLLLACFTLSGLAGLIYQTAWTQQFALVFGATHLAVATVLAAYMAGLAGGAAVAGRWAPRLRRPVRTYALLELGIALSALAVPWALGVARRLQVLALGGMAGAPEAGSLASALFYLVASFAILALPTGLMGATLPLLVRHAVATEAQIGPRVGVLYTANTLGAAGGALLAAFVLLPALGLTRTVLAAAGVNALVFAAAALLARGKGAAPPQPPGPPDVGPPAAGRWILPLVLVSGAVSFTYEVFWSRLLTHLLGGSVYAFGTMLATFLLGLALGSAIAARLATGPRRAARCFAVAQLAIAAFSLGALALIDRLPALARQLAGEGVALLAPAAVLSAATLLPGAVAIGATFPAAVRVLARAAPAAARASARVFAWNTVGAVAGALLTGFVVLPALRFAGTAAVAAAVSLLLAAATALAMRPRSPLLAAVAGLGLVAVLGFVRPSTPWSVLRSDPLTRAELDGEVLYYGVGRSATVLVVDRGGEWRLTSNGLPESAIQPPGARPGRYAVARWLSLLPLAARPDARSLLVVGLGAGNTLEEVPATVEEVHVAELEDEVVAANRAVAGRRRKDPLADPRLRLHLNDARSFLLLSERRYDAIVSQPSHPWTAGSSHLFTRELFDLAARRLEPGGVFVQWIGLEFVDEPLLRSLLAALLEVFPQVEVYQPPPGGALLFLASRDPLEVEETAAVALAAASREWATVGVLVPEDVLAARVLTTEGARRLAAGAPANTDGHNLLQTRAPRLRRPLRRDGAERLFVLVDPSPWPKGRPDHSYLVRRLLTTGAAVRARGAAAGLADPVEREAARGLLLLASRHPREGEEALRALVEGHPGAAGALHQLVLLYRVAFQRGRVPSLPPVAYGSEPTAALIESWRRLAAADWSGLGALEPRLAAVSPYDPLFNEATRLRVRWRLHSGEPGLAAEGLDLLAPLLGPRAELWDLVLRAEAAVPAGDPEAALASLTEITRMLQRQPGRQALDREARRLFGALPPAARDDPRYAAVRQRLQAR